jgi:hypothetical protein
MANRRGTQDMGGLTIVDCRASYEVGFAKVNYQNRSFGIMDRK